MSEFFWDEYTAVIRDRIKKHSDYLSSGSAETYERYKEVAGKISGLKEALVELKDCLKKAGVEDEID